jgi:stage III sporulation protein AD
MEIIRIALIGIGGVFLGLLLKGTKPEFAVFVTLGTGLLILSGSVEILAGLFESLERIRDLLPVDAGYFVILAKMTGIAYIGQFASGICKDAGSSSTGVQVEIFCRLSLLALSMPVLLALLETIEEFLS